MYFGKILLAPIWKPDWKQQNGYGMTSEEVNGGSKEETMSREMVVVIGVDDNENDDGVEAERYLGCKNQSVMDRAESSKEEGE